MRLEQRNMLWRVDQSWECNTGKQVNSDLLTLC